MATDAIYRLAAAAVIAGSLGGCANKDVQTVTVVADTFCMSAKKRTWSVNDTPETIQEAIKQNAGIDRACGKAKTVS